jgi:two-component system, cell cycle response regulator
MFRMRRGDGGWRWFEARARRSDGRGPVGDHLVVGAFRDVTDQRNREEGLRSRTAELAALAHTDPLTGLPNRRELDARRAVAWRDAARRRRPLGLLVVDIDLFKAYNDGHGHLAGDRCLARVAAAVAGALVRPADACGRYGGEEFVVLLPGADATTLEEVAERIRLVVAAEPFELAGPPRLRLRVTASLGGATHPTHAALADELIRTADRALYAAKARGRDRVCIGDVHDRATLLAEDTGLVTALERLADLVDWRQGPDEHSSAVARWAGVVADALGMSAQRRQSLQLAARLHDIGKLALPDAVLGKADPLDEDEWAVLRTHAAEGANLLEGLPGMEDVTPLVRAHHERQDGRGYPDGLGAPDLPVEVGIITVCDAWAAMRAQRVYGPRRSREDARSDLEAGRGTQFDAEVVDLFLALEAAGVVGFMESSGLDKVPHR